MAHKFKNSRSSTFKFKKTDEDFTFLFSDVFKKAAKKGVFSQIPVIDVSITDGKRWEIDEKLTSINAGRQVTIRGAPDRATEISNFHNYYHQEQVIFHNYDILTAIEEVKFTTLLFNSNTNFDVITLTETWMDDTSCPDDYTITGYHPPIAQNRKDGSRGVSLYI